MENKPVRYIINALLVIISSAIVSYFTSFFKDCSAVRTDFGYLSLSISALAFITTVILAVSAYKLFSAKETSEIAHRLEEIILERLKQIESQYSNRTDSIREEQEKFNQQIFSDLVSNIKVMISAIQSTAEKTMKEQGISSKPRHYRVLAEYINEMDKEIISTLMMFLMISSPKPNDRLLGFQLLATQTKNEVILNLFAEKLKIDSDPQVRGFLTNEIFNKVPRVF